MFSIGFSFQLCWYVGLNKDSDRLTMIGFKGGELIRGTYFVEPLTDRCNEDRRCDEADCITNREYFGCDKAQTFVNRLIYGDGK